MNATTRVNDIITTPKAPTYESVSTDQLRDGDVVREHGMVMVLGPIGTYLDRETVVYHSSAQVQNPDDVRGDRMLWGFLHTTHQGEPVYSGVWRVQGNHMARWRRQVR